MRQGAQPVLAGPGGLVIRPWTAADAPAVLAAYSDPAISWWHRRSVESLAEAEQLIAGWTQTWHEETAGNWAVTGGADAAVLGRLVLRVDFEFGQAECGYWVLPAARGAGVASRALPAVSDWALDDLGVHRIELVHSVANQASCQVANKAGYLLEGTMRSASLHSDGWHDMHLHARTAGQAGPDEGGAASL
jgi:[ribosomal protein S5]-alanine N-acetyltransferase